MGRKIIRSKTEKGVTATIIAECETAWWVTTDGDEDPFTIYKSDTAWEEVTCPPQPDEGMVITRMEESCPGSGRFKYTGASGQELRIERSTVSSRRGYVAVRTANSPAMVWIHPDDVEKVINAIRVAARPKCSACNGTGIE
jgi:hypothetical protein